MKSHARGSELPDSSLEGLLTSLEWLGGRISEGLVVLDGHARVLFANPAAQSLFDRPLEDWRGASPGFWAPDGHSTFDETVALDLAPGVAARLDGCELDAESVAWADQEVRIILLHPRMELCSDELRRANDMLLLKVGELARRNRDAILLSELGDLLQSCQVMEETFAVLEQYARKIFPEQSGALYIANASQKLFQQVVSWGSRAPAELVFNPQDCWGLRRGRMHIFSSHANSLRCTHVQPFAPDARCCSTICAPLAAQGETLGVLHLRFFAQENLEDWEQVVSIVIEHMSMAMANLKLREKLRMESIRDPLTNLFNRRYFEETLGRELMHSASHGLPLGLIMLDIDHFKDFNDTHGHGAGDDLLKELGNLLSRSFRNEDLACRYGGEEFVVVLHETDLKNTLARAERLRGEVKKITIRHLGAHLEGVTVSMGVACFPEHGAALDDLMRVADAALYRSKREGRDRVTAAEERRRPFLQEA